MPNGAKKTALNLPSTAVLSSQKLLMLASKKACMYAGNLANPLASSPSTSVRKTLIVR
jgi:hypothetical protein